MISKIAICNLALAQLGQAPIVSLEQEDEKARRLKLFYEPVRDEVLRTHNWAFASAQMTLTLMEKAAPFGDMRVYKYPAQALFIRKVFRPQDPQTHIPFEEHFRDDLQARVLCVPAEQACAEYTRRVTDENLFDPAFVKCFSLALAADLAVVLTGDSTLAGQILHKYTLALDEARRANMTENFLRAAQNDAFSEVR
jgi:hypothetical protein